MRIFGIVFAGLLSCGPLVSEAPAADIHVATNGSDRNAGTLSQPVKAIARGLQLADHPGDRVLVHQGVYSVTRPIAFPNSGLAGSPIQLLAVKGESVTIDGLGTPADTDLVVVGVSHIRIEGLNIRNSKRNGVAIWGPGQRVHHVEVVGNTIYNCDLSGIYAGYRTLEDPVHDILMENNHIRDVVMRNFRERKGSWSFGIGAGLTRNVTIRDNRVHMAHGEAIGLYLSKECRMEGNTVSDGYAVNIYLDNTTDTSVTRNMVFNTGQRKFLRFGHPAPGIQIANESYPGMTNPSSGNKITNNVIVAGRFAFYYGSYQNGGGLRDTLFANNTCYAANDALLKIDPDQHRNLTIENNIFVQTGGSKIAEVLGQTKGLLFRNNLWFGGQPLPELISKEDVFADPMFKMPGSFAPENYQLKQHSPALEAAGSTGMKNDFRGRPRKQPSIGAW